MNDGKPMRVMCVDDHAFLIEGLRARLSAESGMTFVGSRGTLEGLLAEVEKLAPDVLLVDVEVPGPDVFQVIAQLRRARPAMYVVVLSAHIRDRYIDSAIAAGANGYLAKSADPSAIIDALRRLDVGEFVVSPGVEARVQSHRPASDPAPRLASKLRTLTGREQQILRMIGLGMSRVQIASAIHRSPKTVDAHRASIMEKLGIHDRVELARYAIREGLVEV